MMGNIGLPGLLLLVVVFGAIVFPFWKLFPKFGMSKWLSLLAILPFFPIILLWVLAFSEPVRPEETRA